MTRSRDLLVRVGGILWGCRNTWTACSALSTLGTAAAAILPHVLPFLFLFRREEFSNMLIGGSPNHGDSSSQLGLGQVGIASHFSDSFCFMFQEGPDFSFLLSGKIKLLV